MGQTFREDAGGRQLRLLESYIEARRKTEAGIELMLGQEAMSTSDFPTYIASFLRYRFIERFNEVVGQWGQWTSPQSVRDFETYTSSRLGRFADMPQKGLNAEYEQLAIRELPGPSWKLIEWGFGFGVTRQLVISDREDKFNDLPSLAADSAARTISKRAVAVLESNPTMYDGNALFDAANHLNLVSTNLTADQAGATALKTAMDAIDTQTDAEGYKIVQPTAQYYLVIPRALRWIATALRDRELLPVDGTATALLRANEVQGRFEIIEDWYLTSTTKWYLLVEPRNVMYAPIVGLTLNGNDQPFIGLRNPAVRGIYGGDDPYSFDFDELEYKVRHDFDFVANEWRGAYRGGA